MLFLLIWILSLTKALQRKDFQKERGGHQLFKLNLGIEKDKNGDFFRQLSINFYKIFTCSSKHHILFDHLLCILCLNDSKEYSYSAIYIKDNNISNLVHKKCQKVQKGNQFFKFTSSGFGKKGGTKIFSKILGGEQSLAHCVEPMSVIKQDALET